MSSTQIRTSANSVDPVQVRESVTELVSGSPSSWAAQRRRYSVTDSRRGLEITSEFLVPRSVPSSTLHTTATQLLCIPVTSTARPQPTARTRVVLVRFSARSPQTRREWLRSPSRDRSPRAWPAARCRTKTKPGSRLRCANQSFMDIKTKIQKQQRAIGK